MQATKASSNDTNDAPSYLPSVMPTDEAAAVLNRMPQTLRRWACQDNGPISPVRINGRLAWRVSDLRALLDGSAK